MIYGFTGTRHKVTKDQLVWLHKQLDDADELHHGACVGADTFAHESAVLHGVPVIVHPPVNRKAISEFCLRAPTYKPDAKVTVLQAQDYLIRNGHIVDACDVLLALPEGPERMRSGTWYTIRYAVRVGVPVRICWPDGYMEER